MAQGEFLWCDLATFDVDATLEYYRDMFEWETKSEEFTDGSVYYYASNRKDVTAGIYEMPSLYKEAKMPSFWMSYIGVDDVPSSLHEVERLGGKLVLGPATFGNGATIAMVEDPFGAKFTLFSGAYLQPRSIDKHPGGHFWNELYTPDPMGVAKFYKELFGWVCQETDQEGRYRVNNLAGRMTTAFQDNSSSPEPLNKPQWTVTFACTSIETLIERLGIKGCPELAWVRNADGAAVCLTDPNGAAFFISEVAESSGWFS